ncbi:ATP-binding cassette domain-containing protein [Solimonas sp. K1W22B-7]|uniref:ATP-binding cassette domain-containing protein n=1 Tax=Solimonas sp. K1W22B-7 TaxID=2303331 RepID=UPI0013C45F7C|nr:ATP-binding cassette domain-containing protein [Solimonas sp. K1W22B-7]
MRFRSFLSDLLPFLAPHRLLLAGVIAGLMVDVAFHTALPLSIKFLIDRAIVPGDRRLLGWTLGLLVGGVAIAAVTTVWRDWLYARLGSAVLQGVRQRLFAHIQTLSLDFFGRVRTGDLMGRFSTDLASVENVVVGSLPNSLSATMSLVLVGIALVWLDPGLAAVTAIAVPFCLVGPRLLLPRAAALGYEARQRDAEVLSVVQENLSAQQAVKALGLEARAVAQMDRHLQSFTEASRRFNFISYLAERAPNVMVLLFHVGILAWGAQLAFDQRISIGTLVAFNTLLLSLGAAVATLTANVPTFLQAGAGMRRIREILDERPSVVVSADAIDMPPLARGLELDNVTYRYRSQVVLHGLGLRVERGSSVAIVGPSGCGKSTVLRLLARFADPSEGRVLIDGQDLRGLSIASLRRRVGVVLQDSTLFEASLRDNIRLARPEASDAEVEQAAALAAADAFVRDLPQGYDTPVGAGRQQLSGGQRQRIAIARVLLLQPDLLLLDEATSALDPVAERAVTQTLMDLRGRHTLVQVTHQLAQARECDRIVVLDAGRLAEQGSHEQLLAANGLYARMWRKQQGVVVSDDLASAAVSAGWLAEQPLFEGADEALLGQLAQEFVTDRRGPGHEVIRQGAVGNRFYIIARGTVSVRREEDGEEIELARLHHGDAFGEAALLSSAPRNASVLTLTDCVFLTLDRTRFQRWLDAHPEARARLEALAASRAGD